MNARCALYAQVQKHERDELVSRHAPIVKRIALHVISRLPSSVQLDDLIQAGMIGLLEASRNFDASQGASFETYASIRVRGAMLDEVRGGDWTPRSVSRKLREASQAVQAVEQETGRDARDHEVAERMGISLGEYHEILKDSTSSRLYSLDQENEEGQALDVPADGLEPLSMMQHEDFQQALAEAIKQLPERQQLMMSLYYNEELNLREIGEVLGVSESRVCQIHGQAMINIRAKLSVWLERDL